MHRQAFPFDVKEMTEAGTFAGYGAVFGNVDHGRDVIQPGAFTETLAKWRAKGKWPKMLWAHNARQPIGAWTEMKEDSFGLFVRGRLTKGVQAADEAHLLMKDDALDGLSIGYETLDDEYDQAMNIRKLIKLELHEVSPVAIAMNEEACISMVKAIDLLDSLSDAERLLREADGPFSRKDAMEFVSVVKKIAQREAGADPTAALLAEIRRVKAHLAA